MSRTGRPPGPLKGRTPEANALALFLRELTEHDTVSRLEERYQLSRSVWSEYRSGQKLIPLARLNQIIENRYARDARTRTDKLQQARRLHTAATAASPAPAPPPHPAAPSGAPPTAGHEEGEGTAAWSESKGPAAEEAPVPTRAEPIPPPIPPAGSTASPQPRDQAPDGSADEPADEPAGDTGPRERRATRTGRRGRWRTPAQWAALAALVAALVIANHFNGPQQTPDSTSLPGDTAQEQPIAAPAVPDPGATASAPPEEPAPASPPPSSSGEQTPPPVPSGWHTVRAEALRQALAVPDDWKPDVDNALQSTWVSPDGRYVIGVKRDDSNGHTAPAAATGQLAWYGKTEESKMVALTAETQADSQGGKDAVRLELDYHWPARETPCHRTELFVTGEGGQVYQLLVNDQQYDEQTSDLPQLLSTARAQWRTDLTD